MIENKINTNYWLITSNPGNAFFYDNQIFHQFAFPDQTDYSFLKACEMTEEEAEQKLQEFIEVQELENNEFI